MTFWKIITLACTASIIVDAKWHHHIKREIPIDICATGLNSTNKVQCYCVSTRNEPPTIIGAECYLTKSISNDNSAWTTFKTISTIHKLTLINTRGVPLTYVPTEALKETPGILKLDIRYAQINTIGSFAFANLSSVEEMILRDNQIIVLDPYAFIHHKSLKTISLDGNNIAEINRNVFVNLPKLEKLYLTNNQISTIHDRAFINLTNLKELEIDRNKVFSLNFAVFQGLTNLERLELSSNGLEVIGDNTFQALENLKSLNLEGNKIQMLDDKAFNGLSKLLSLSLARNKLADIDSDKVFEGLESLRSLSLKGNQLKQLNGNVIAPILSNFYGNTSNLDVEDNNFTCDCSLEWFMSLMNKTLNKHLQITTENLKCVADAHIKELYAKAEEIEKNTPSALEAEEPKGQGTDYEYYDEAPLANGQMFYIDVRDLINCNKDSLYKAVTNITTIAPVIANISLTTTTSIPTEASTAEIKHPSHSTIVDTATIKNEVTKPDKNREHNETKPEVVTTTLSQASAKPVETKIYENMASDEAKPDKTKAHRSIPEPRTESRRIEEDTSNTNNANKNLGCVMLIVTTVLSFRLST